MMYVLKKSFCAVSFRFVSLFLHVTIDLKCVVPYRYVDIVYYIWKMVNARIAGMKQGMPRYVLAVERK